MVWEEVALLRHSHPPSGSGDNNGDARGGEQDMPYANVDAMICDRQQEEGGEGNIDDGSGDKHVNGRVRSP